MLLPCDKAFVAITVSFFCVFLVCMKYKYNNATVYYYLRVDFDEINNVRRAHTHSMLMMTRSEPTELAFLAGKQVIPEPLSSASSSAPPPNTYRSVRLQPLLP